jgi:hypothetical protein
MQPDDIELEDQLREALHATAGPLQGDGVRIEAVRSTVARRQRNRWRIRAALVTAAAAAVVAVVLMAMPDSGSRVDTIGRPDQTTSTDPAVPGSGHDERIPSGPASSTTLDSGVTATSPSTTPSTVPSTTTSSSTTSTLALPEFPPELTGLTHGGESWALYLAVVPYGGERSPEMNAADGAAAEAGYGSVGPQDLACDQGAAEALGRVGDWVAAAVYFETEAQASQARSAFEARDHPVVGIVHVTNYCLD